MKNNKTVSKKTPSNKSKPKEKSEAAKARDEARKKMLEERKRMMKEKAKAQAAGEDGLILIMWSVKFTDDDMKVLVKTEADTW